jgi:hypothetical protein
MVLYQTMCQKWSIVSREGHLLGYASLIIALGLTKIHESLVDTAPEIIFTRPRQVDVCFTLEVTVS